MSTDKLKQQKFPSFSPKRFANFFPSKVMIETDQCVNPFITNVPHDIETSQLICNENQFTGFYVMGNIGR